MSRWFEVFENDRVQFVTRERVLYLVYLGGSTLLLVVAGALFIATRQVPLEVGLPVLLIALALPGSYVIWSLHEIARIVWCVKLSDRGAIGYDFARRKRSFDWTQVDRVELATTGLRLIHHRGDTLEVPHLFPNFADLSHRIIEYAEFYSIPVCIEGQRWEEVDVKTLYGLKEQ